jgi:hypothetical protein
MCCVSNAECADRSNGTSGLLAVFVNFSCRQATSGCDDSWQKLDSAGLNVQRQIIALNIDNLKLERLCWACGELTDYAESCVRVKAQYGLHRQ